MLNDRIDQSPKILIVDDEKAGRARLELICPSVATELNAQIEAVGSLEEAYRVLAQSNVYVVLLDKQLKSDVGETDGIEAIPHILQLQANAQIIVITSSLDNQDAARAVSLGAFWFLPKRTSDELVRLQIRKAFLTAQAKIERECESRQKPQATVADLVGHSVAIRTLRDRIHGVAETNKPVLLLGETGTGKTTAAKIIHERRKSYLGGKERPFFAVNMGAISPELAERELFGNERGAFTDAREARPGIFELAHGGTLFLDEIGEAPLELQVKLLKVIEEGRYYRLGGTMERQTQFKLICATNRDLEAMVANKEFREDLFMRISTFPITIPTLRDRLGDIPDIIRSLLSKCCRDNNVFIEFEDLPDEFVQSLMQNPPRGNIRGIEQQLSRLLVYAPKDRRGRPQFAKWTEIPGLLPKRAYNLASKNLLTSKDFMHSRYDVMDTNFPGLKAFLDHVAEQVVREAMNKFKTLKEISSALDISIGTASAYRSRIRRESKHFDMNASHVRNGVSQ